MVSVAMGCAARGRCVPFISTFGVFFSRAMDQIRVAAISQSNINFCGSHCGFSAAGDGPTQMALADIALFRTVQGSTIFYPSDAVAAERAVELAANHDGICYIRTTKVAMPIIYDNNEEFAIGKAKVIRKTSHDRATVIACCATLFEALDAADDMAKSHVNIRIIDPFTIKPLDVETIVTNVSETAGNVVIVEDHYSEGGIGEAVTSALESHGHFNIRRLAVKAIPHCGDHGALLERYHLSSKYIKDALQELLQG